MVNNKKLCLYIMAAILIAAIGFFAVVKFARGENFFGNIAGAPTEGNIDPENQELAEGAEINEEKLHGASVQVNNPSQGSSQEEEINNYIIENIESILSFFAAEPHGFVPGGEVCDPDDLYVMQPLEMYETTDGRLEAVENILWYPVVSQGRVLCTISGFIVNGNIYDNVSTWLVEELNEVNYPENFHHYVLLQKKKNSETFKVDIIGKEKSSDDPEGSQIMLDLSGRFSSTSQ